ncbi:MAG: hypothetical protein IJ800_01865 [Clostridia bacterium]|nr:hypothetical protein [Clostridia bacterium]
MSKKNKKDKKEKIVYYDDGSTIADMSAVNKYGKKDERPRSPKKNSTFKEKWNTYWDAVRLMVIPMFIVLGFLLVLYLVGILIANF